MVLSPPKLRKQSHRCYQMTQVRTKHSWRNSDESDEELRESTDEASLHHSSVLLEESDVEYLKKCSDKKHK